MNNRRHSMFTTARFQPAKALTAARAVRVVCVIVAAAIPLTANTQTTPGSLADMVKQALVLRTDTALASLDQDVARARLDETRAADRPSLDLTVSNDVTSIYDPFTGITATAVINGQPVSVDVTRSAPRSVLVANLRLSYPLYTGGRNKALRNEAIANLSAANAQQDVTATQVAQSVALAWFDVHRANQRVINAQQEEAITAQQVQLLEVRVGRGLSARIELESQRNRIASLTNSINQLTASRRARWIHLANVRGLPGIPPEPDWSRFTNAGLLGESISRLRTFIKPDAADQHHEQKINAAREKARASGSAYKPRVSLFAQYNTAGRSDGTEWVPLNNVRRSDLVIGARLEWNLYNGGATDARVARGAAELTRRQLQRDESARQRSLVASESESQLLAQRHKLSALTIQTTLLARKLDIAQVKLQSGRTDQRAMLNLRLEQLGLTGNIRLAQLDLLSAHIKAMFARALPGTTATIKP